MVITKIEIQKNNKEKVNIYVDEEYLFSLSLNGVNKYGLYNGKNITNEEVERFKKEDSSELAFLYLMDRLSYKMYTKKELIEKLEKKEFNEDAINDAVEKAKQYGYINDSYYAKCFIEQRGIPNKWGDKIIYQKLLQKGIDKDIINESLNEFLNDEDEKENCYYLASKKIKSLGDIDFNDRKVLDKLYRYLLSKGYSYETINITIDKIKRDLE